jgi:hypothetical protein
MTVKDLIALLQTFDADLPIAYELHSEHKLLKADDLKLDELQLPRKDGWIHNRWPSTPPLPTRRYIVFPGN